MLLVLLLPSLLSISGFRPVLVLDRRFAPIGAEAEKALSQSPEDKNWLKTFCEVQKIRFFYYTMELVHTYVTLSVRLQGTYNTYFRPLDFAPLATSLLELSAYSSCHAPWGLSTQRHPPEARCVVAGAEG